MYYEQYFLEKGGQVDNALLCSRYRLDLGYRVSHLNGYVKFECIDRYYCIQKAILNGDDLLS